MAVTKMMTILITIISLFMGVLFFYLITDIPKEQKKKQIGEMITQVINFILFLWASKIILNLPLFLRDPLSILAYPSNSSAFYLAIFLHAIWLIYKSKRGQMDLRMFIKSFIPVFLAGTFLYEFFQFSLNNNTLAVGSMGLQGALLIFYLYFQGTKTLQWQINFILSGYTLGLFGLSMVQPYITIFGYLITSWFLLAFYVTGLTINLVNQRKEGSS